MTAEGAIAITAALLAGSVALLGFGLDSAIEALASVIVIWRFTGTRRLSQDAERHAQRLVAISFFLLAPYIAQDAIRTLIAGEHPHTSWLGIGLSISSIIVMPQLGNAKHRIGQRLGSGATAGEGTQNLLCAYLAAGVLASLALNAAFGLWWADPAVALAIAALAIKEGHQTWQGEGCCATRPSTAKPTPAAPTTAATNPCGIGREADHDHDHTVGATGLIGLSSASRRPCNNRSSPHATGHVDRLDNRSRRTGIRDRRRRSLSRCTGAGAVDRCPAPARGLGEVDQGVEILGDRRRADAQRIEQLARAAIVETQIEREVGEVDLAAHQSPAGVRIGTRRISGCITER